MIRSPTPAVERMRQYRRRRRWKRLIVRVELDAIEIEVLATRGYLNSREKGNLDAIQQAANDLISDAFCLEGFVHAAALEMPRSSASTR